LGSRTAKFNQLDDLGTVGKLRGSETNMAREQFEKGLKCRKEVLGEGYVDAALNKADDFNRDFQDLVTEYCWGGTWGRGVLTKQQRSLLNLGMLAGSNRPYAFKLYFRGAITNGVSLEKLREILIQIAVYCGTPAGIEAFRLDREVYADRGIDVSNMDANP